MPKGQTEYHRFTSNELILVRMIDFQGKRVGVVQIESDLGEVRERLVRYGGIVGVVLLMSLMAAFIFSSIFQERHGAADRSPGGNQPASFRAKKNIRYAPPSAETQMKFPS